MNITVAPRVGAWIETYCTLSKAARTASHPVWVRGLKLYSVLAKVLAEVAPRVGAWIETTNKHLIIPLVVSHPVWVRGLKLYLAHRLSFNLKSHPVWVRGLKL